MGRREAHGANESVARAPRGRRGRFAHLNLEQLRALFVETIGRTTESNDRRYLEWKIREATHGRVRVGPPRRAAREANAMMTLPWRLPRATVARIDDARMRLGMHTRSALLARAVAELLDRCGEGAVGAEVRATAAVQTPTPGDPAADERNRTTG
jgi:hypothetical protein